MWIERRREPSRVELRGGQRSRGLVALKVMGMSMGLLVLQLLGCGPDEPTKLQENCNAYCDESLETCRDGNEQYASFEACLNACADFPRTGTEGDRKGDTFQCRLYHLSVASTDPELHCPHSGPTGAGQCVDEVTACERYCGQVDESCQAVPQYESTEECLMVCNADIRNSTDATGNTVQCRLEVLTEAPGEKTQRELCEAAGKPGVSTVCVDAAEQ